MSFISNVRNRRQQQLYIKQNDSVFNDYLKNNLGRDDLESVIDMMAHPEVHAPLLNHADALLRQDNFDNELRTKFVESLNKLPPNKLRDEVIAKASIDNNSLSANLNVAKKVDDVDEIPFKGRIKQRIKDSYTAISERLEARTDKMKAPYIKARERIINGYTRVVGNVSESGRTLYNNTAPVVDMISERARNQLSRVQDEFRTRKLTYQNDANFAKALSDGISVEALNEGLNNFEYPEIRYALMNNAQMMFEQKAMTPELATSIYLAAEPYLNDNKLSSKFIDAFNNYADTVELPVEDADVQESVKEPDIKDVTLTGFTEDGKTQWQSDSDKVISEDEFMDELMAQYDAESHHQDAIIPPDIDDDAYFKNLSSSFETELSEEDDLMNHAQDAAFLDDLNEKIINDKSL